MKNFGYVLKDIDKREYYCGRNKWNSRISKAEIYHYFHDAVIMMNDKRWAKRAIAIKAVELKSNEDTKAERKKFLKSFWQMKLFE